MSGAGRVLAGLGADLAAGFGLLTHFPVGWLVRPGQPYRPGRAIWCYPLAGAAIGALVGTGLVGARSIGFGPGLAAAWALCAALLLTGGLHEDGLADLADGCGGGHTPEQRLEIMRDSRIGAFGALALGICLLIRFGAMSALASRPGPETIGILAAACALSRMAMLPVLRLPPARADGLGRSLGTPTCPVLAGMVLTATLIAVATLPLRLVPGALVVSVVVGWGISRFAVSRLGGRTGDVLGACVMAAECVLLSLATVLPPA
ncbi:adenosylcobinamide-GDP ribazoletransferase [Acetobacteraceae bacterium KSS8]|uniref:Adenosylcobinamide-GDP ribazoletransferase n=1 Tax=Endosaccharibacter trunci TaxID=2812733 RepID=A0ABT1W3T1_9PROT|nr:adenosylcobinamide-GDP ribazoletransferase [Acetobacteraceae bacterium KSS8]